VIDALQGERGVVPTSRFFRSWSGRHNRSGVRVEVRYYDIILVFAFSFDLTKRFKRWNLLVDVGSCDL